MTILPVYLEAPAYSPSLASRLVGLRPDRVRRWLRGYEYEYAPMPRGGQRVRKRQGPLVRSGDSADSPYASFLDLIDLLFVKSFVEHGVSIQKLRRALAEAETLLGDRHFAQRRFWTDGRKIYLEVHEKSDALIQLLANGQWVIAPIIKQIAQHIDFQKETGLAERWYPMGRKEHVVVDPRVAFGAPSIVGRGVETANVYDLYQAERKQVDAVCSWMDLPPQHAQAAIKFEEMLRAA